MKTKDFIGITCAVLFVTLKIGAQVTQATNAPLSSSYVGTSTNLDVIFKRQAVFSGLLSTTTTSFGVNSFSLPSSVSLGVNAGQYSSGIGNNTYVGTNAGRGLNSSTLNSGSYNSFFGVSAGTQNSSGSSNTFNGQGAGLHNNTGNYNVFVGAGAGAASEGGHRNTYIGSGAGMEEGNNGSGNVFLGFYAGFSEQSTSNKLVIGNDEYIQLIWGDFALNQLKLNGKVGIGYNFGSYPTASGGINLSNYNLFVKGGLLAEEVRVSTTWADYVFNDDYKLPTLEEVEKHIVEKGHLINVPSAKQVEADGIELGNMAKIQQEKIEELTLYIIEQHKINEKQALMLASQNAQIQELKKLIDERLAK
ncbi:MAG TPA: hypothetical protein VF676_12050 [Flavobacterium sp.]|jgi:hypothetical protein